MIALTTMSTGMMSMIPSGAAGKSGSSPRPKARMIGSAILKPSIQPGWGRASALSMIDGRTTLTASGTGVLLEVALAERLGHRVAVGPAQAAGALAPGADELLAYPLLAQPLGFDRDGRQPGAADVIGGLLVEAGQRLGGA